MKYCDLHTHSTFSDGSDTPTALLDAAQKLDLSAIALCDHNTTDGLREFLTAAKGRNITAIAGAEFSVDWNGIEQHLLALFIPEKWFDQIEVRMKSVNESKKQSNIQLINALNAAGYAIDYHTIAAKTPNGKFNRSQIADELVEKGYLASKEEAFANLLEPECGFYNPPQRLTFWEMLDFILDIGAVPVLAHPLLKNHAQGIEELLPAAKKRGLVGMECLYSDYDAATTQTAFALADTFGLAYSGGSDFHGSAKPGITLGAGRGNLQIPAHWAEILAEAARH